MTIMRPIVPELQPLGSPIASGEAQLGEQTALQLLRFRHWDSEVSFVDPKQVSIVVSLSNSQLVERVQEGRHEEKGAKTGTLSVIDPMIATRFAIRGFADVLILRLPYQEIREIVPGKQVSVHSVFNEQLPAIERIAYDALAAVQTGVMPDDLLASIMIAKLAKLITGTKNSTPLKGGLGSLRIRRVRELMHEYAAVPRPTSPKLAALADELGLSVYHFAREFHRSFGRSPHAYMLRLRLEQAKMLVVETEKPILEISRAAGFASHSHFTSRFHKEFGLVPTALRQAVRL